MKLSRIKKACMDEGVIRLYSVEKTGNAIFQWLGTNEALYAVEGCELTLTTLQAIWEIDSKKAANLDMVEDTLRGAVERRLLTDRDVHILTGAPALIDMENAPLLSIIVINDHRVIACGDDRVIFVPEARFAPCYAKAILSMEYYENGDTGEPAWIATYTDGKLCGMVRPVKKVAAERLRALAKEVARRESAAIEA